MFNYVYTIYIYIFENFRTSKRIGKRPANPGLPVKQWSFTFFTRNLAGSWTTRWTRCIRTASGLRISYHETAFGI